MDSSAEPGSPEKSYSARTCCQNQSTIIKTYSSSPEEGRDYPNKDEYVAQLSHLVSVHDDAAPLLSQAEEEAAAVTAAAVRAWHLQPSVGPLALSPRE